MIVLADVKHDLRETRECQACVFRNKYCVDMCVCVCVFFFVKKMSQKDSF